jgi:uncharacterized protein (DUF952 family)
LKESGEIFVAEFYKITTAEEWRGAEDAGEFKGSALDLKDGFIHLSTAAQLRETARLHFAGQRNLLLVAIDEVEVAPNLKWEASRGGKLFPHVFAPLDPARVLWVKPLPWDGTSHQFPADFAP